MGLGTAEHHLLNPRGWPTITTTLPISGETMVEILPRLHTSDALGGSKINIFFSLYFLRFACGATTRVRRTIASLTPYMSALHASRLEPRRGSTPTPTAISSFPPFRCPPDVPPPLGAKSESQVQTPRRLGYTEPSSQSMVFLQTPHQTRRTTPIPIRPLNRGSSTRLLID